VSDGYSQSLGEDGDTEVDKFGIFLRDIGLSWLDIEDWRNTELYKIHFVEYSNAVGNRTMYALQLKETLKKSKERNNEIKKILNG